MHVFKDYYHNTVKLSFEEKPFSSHPKHVWAICRYQGKWLLTEHEDRGYEFPGGKLSRMKKQTKPLYGRFKKRRVLLFVN